jgi:hypothetical protein
MFHNAEKLAEQIVQLQDQLTQLQAEQYIAMVKGNVWFIAMAEIAIVNLTDILDRLLIQRLKLISERN